MTVQELIEKLYALPVDKDTAEVELSIWINNNCTMAQLTDISHLNSRVFLISQ